MRLHVAILLLSLAVLHVCSLPLGSFGNYKAQEEGSAASTTTKGVGESGGGQDQPGARHSKGGGGGRRQRSGEIHGGGESDDSSAKLSAIKLSGTNGIKGFRTFVDEEGRERIFHGVNAVVKGPPWIPTYGAFDVETSLGPDDFEILQDLGVNVIRLGIMWAGIEPTRGTYHEPYLIAAKKIASQAAKYGIYTLLDMHQDVLSDKFCGEGVPAWAAQPKGMPFPMPRAHAYTDKDENGFPTGQDCNKLSFSNYYFTQAVGTAFQALYDNTDGLLDAWGAMWAVVTQVFKNDTHILGMELINEPWAGDVIKDPALLAPGVADKKTLQPAYEKLSRAIHDVDDTRLIFFEGVTWGHVGFDRVPGGPPYSDRSVLAYHHYEIPAGPRMWNTSYTEIEKRIADSQRLKSGLFLSEFAEAGGPGGDIWDMLTGACDRHGQSWASWEYKTFCKDDADQETSQCGSFGCCRTGFGGHMWLNASDFPYDLAMSKLARTYATAIAGEMITSYFDAKTSIYTLAFAPNISCVLPTVIYTSEQHHYPWGLDVTISPPGSAIWIRIPNGVEISQAQDQPGPPVARIDVKITPVKQPHE